MGGAEKKRTGRRMGGRAGVEGDGGPQGGGSEEPTGDEEEDREYPMMCCLER